MRKRTIKARLVRRGPDEEAFDREFWAEVDPSAKLELLWDAVLEADVWQGGDGSHPRLQKSVCRLRLRQKARKSGNEG
ncbi:MAG: hypothetical protein ACYTG3_10505 [Planctomycetota bacterium]|jgi:hypothetical protein